MRIQEEEGEAESHLQSWNDGDQQCGGLGDLPGKMFTARCRVLGQSWMWWDTKTSAWALHFLAGGICKCTPPTFISCWFPLNSVIITGSIRHLLTSMDVAKATGGWLMCGYHRRAAWVAAADLLWSICIAAHLPSGFCCDLWIQIDPRLVSVNNKYFKIRIQAEKFWKG